jgi:integrase
MQQLLDSYLNFLRITTKRNGRRYNERSTLAREANIRQLIRFINKPYVEQLNRADMLRYKEQLYSEGKANDTVGNKLLTVTTWLRHNQTVSITGLLLPADWPVKRKTKPQPFREAEIKAMMECATPAERLLLRLALGTGMRKGELSHAERSDIDQFSQCIRIKDKPKYGWETKTLAGIREIPLGDDLLHDLLALPLELLFPNTEGQPDDHIDRIFEAVGTRAGVQPPVDDKASWCHRWRDSFATQQVRARKLQLRDIARILGHEDLQTMDLYAEFVRMDSTEAREAANAVDVHGAGPRLVKRA